MTDPDDVQRRTWTIGDYPAVARHLLPISVETADALPITDGTRILDVGTGDGNFAIEAARRGAVVVGIDLTPQQIERARRRSVLDGVEVDLRLGDAEDLPVEDGSFDVVASVLGMMYAPDHERAAAEMVRACRPGGCVASVVWSGGGWSEVWQRRSAHLMPPIEGAPRIDQWADPDEARRRWTAAGLVDVRVRLRPFHWNFTSADEAASFFTETAGPFITFLERAASFGVADEARAVLVDALGEASVETDGAVTMSHPYVLSIGSRAVTAFPGHNTCSLRS